VRDFRHCKPGIGRFQEKRRERRTLGGGKEADTPTSEFAFLLVNARSPEHVGQKIVLEKHTATVLHLIPRPDHKVCGTKRSE